MRSILTIAALAGLAFAARHFAIFLSEREKNRLAERKLETWEGEGGAVPVAATRTAAQVRPPKPSAASSSGVG
jgi:NhaP-type Na+/H+ or K+/H+ antiporter